MSEKAYKPKKGENFLRGLRRLEFPEEVDAVPGKGLRVGVRKIPRYVTEGVHSWAFEEVTRYPLPPRKLSRVEVSSWAKEREGLQRRRSSTYCSRVLALRARCCRSVANA